MAAQKNIRKKNKVTESVPESFEYFLRWLLGALVSVYTVLILGVLPFYFEEGFTHIGTDKSTFFRTSTVHMSYFIGPVLALWLIFWVIIAVMKKRKDASWKPDIQWSLPDTFALAYGVAVALSYLCTEYRETALWGTKGWFMGTLPHLTLVAIYFLVSRFQKGAKWMLYLTMCVSAITFVLGYLNRFDIWPLEMANSGLPNFISTIGNINWYCGYIVSVAFIGIGLFWLDKGEKQWYSTVLAVYTFVSFAALLTQGSDSGLFALVFVWAVMFVLSAKSETPDKMKRFWCMVGLFALAGTFTWCIRFVFPERMNYTTGLGNLFTFTPMSLVIMVLALTGWWYAGKQSSAKLWQLASRAICIGIPLVIVVFAVLLTVNTLKPDSLGALSKSAVFTFDNQWGSSRGATWKLGAMCFAEQDGLHKLVGVGPDCMVEHLYKGRSEELRIALKEAFPSKRLTNAHNEFLTLLVNEGVLGLAAFAGLLFGLARRLLQNLDHNKYAAVCGLCLIGYIANNTWSFQQSLSVSTLFVIAGLGMCFLRGKDGGNQA